MSFEDQKDQMMNDMKELIREQVSISLEDLVEAKKKDKGYMEEEEKDEDDDGEDVTVDTDDDEDDDKKDEE